MLSAGYAFMGQLPITLGNLGYLYIQVAVPVAAGLTIGSLIWYIFAYQYGESAIKRFGKYVFVSWEEIAKVKAKYESRHKSEVGLFILRAVPLLPSIIINLVAGLLQVKFIPYLISTFFGTTVRVSIIAFVGWQVGELYRTYAEVIDKSEKATLVVIALSIIVYIFYKKRKK
jgi:membrane protein DedA with SNARE-associated domain